MKKLTNFAAALLAVFLLSQTVSASQLLIPVGQVIGMELSGDNVTVGAFEGENGEKSQNAGLQTGDQILRVDGQKISCAQDVRSALDRSDGSVRICVLRNGKEKNLRLTPGITPDGPRLGIYLKEGITGIGTVTFYDPDTDSFGALGHGVNQPGGTLLQMRHGKIYKAGIRNIQKGKAGTPGRLVGSLETEAPLGVLEKNTLQGIFGNADDCWSGEAIPVGEKEDVHSGDALIRCTVSGTTPREYSVKILKIYPISKDGCRNMLLRVTDPALLEATGGIVQGMSGSPIIQDGKLIGAVTHVLVNDPTTGYGIFIENMLNAAA